MAASSSSAAADSRPPKYDVFISFRGEDTRKSFTSHLYSALSGKQIEAYIDEVSLEKGDTISPALLKAIEESEISIIVFSENYASSSWCLDELVHILKGKKDKARIVLPIFLGIDTSHIRNQKETYAAAFEKHEERFETEKVQKWRQALKDAADISGWDSWNMSESEIVEQVVKRVRTELDTIMSKRSDDMKGLVGIPKRLEKMKSFIDSPTVCSVGIWGMGGIGKTTLTKLVFKRFYSDFDCSYFAHDVRENAIKKGLDTLKKEVFSELLGEKNVDTLKSDVNDRLSRKRILLVLDDVKDPIQFEDLVGDCEWFCPGSKIIVTSRDKLNVDKEYKVEELDFKDACKLFYLKAFGDESCRSGFEGISDRVVEYTKGLPLALKVLGASVFFFLKSIDEWEKEMKKLKRIRNDKIQKVLEISYDALDDEEKGLFLDIACFFKEQRINFVKGILEDKPISGLVRKSLITIDQHGLINMHDLIQEMGRDIVLRSTSPSRLWIAKDVYDVLENNKGTEAIEGIYLPWNEEDEVHLRPDVFEKMRKLRLLKFYDASHYYLWNDKVKVYIDGDLKYLPNGLRYLHWENYPVKSLPSNFKPQNLVELHMPHSKLEQLWDGVQKLGSLKHFDLSFSEHLTKIPDLSLAPKLESIYLSSCRSLIHIPSLNLRATVDESAYRHEGEGTPGCIILKNCLGLTTLPEVSGNIRKLVLAGTALQELPSSIESLENLLVLDLSYCDDLKSLPKLPRNIEELLLDHSGIEQSPSSSIEGLCSLPKLSLCYCESLLSLQFNINLKALKELKIIQTSIQELPSSIGVLYNLEDLYIKCRNLRSLPASIGMLYKLVRLDIRECENLQSLPASIIMLYSLKQLFIVECRNLRSLPASIGMLYKLKFLDISGCENLQSLPASIGKLYNLEYLFIVECRNLRSLPASIGMLYKLVRLDIMKCENLQSLPELPLFIEYVEAKDCSSLEMILSLRSTLTLGRWLDKYDGEYDRYDARWEFSFLNCRKLGEDAINNIFREFLYKVFCTATTPPKVVHSERAIGELHVCYPTKEIPRWFNNQSEGSSITITLPPNWYNPKTFLGFVVSVVVVVKDEEVEDEYKNSARVDCDLCLMTNKDRFRDDVFRDFTIVTSCLDHIVVWYNYFDHSKENFEKYQEASLQFFSCSGIVKRCGVRLLYLKDAVEESDDGTTANFESWITYDSDEPPPKTTQP